MRIERQGTPFTHAPVLMLFLLLWAISIAPGPPETTAPPPNHFESRTTGFTQIAPLGFSLVRCT